MGRVGASIVEEARFDEEEGAGEESEAGALAFGFDVGFGDVIFVGIFVVMVVELIVESVYFE